RSGHLWVALTEGGVGRLLIRKSGGAFGEVTLPSTPAEPLDDRPVSAEALKAAFGDEPPPPNRGRALPPVPLWIDASDDDEVLVLARVGDTTEKRPIYPPGIGPGVKWVPAHQPGDGFELALFSTKMRSPILRVPSQLAQRSEPGSPKSGTAA